jgi:hypothetical protein
MGVLQARHPGSFPERQQQFVAIQFDEMRKSAVAFRAKENFDLPRVRSWYYFRLFHNVALLFHHHPPSQNPASSTGIPQYRRIVIHIAFAQPPGFQLEPGPPLKRQPVEQVIPVHGRDAPARPAAFGPGLSA